MNTNLYEVGSSTESHLVMSESPRAAAEWAFKMFAQREPTVTVRVFGAAESIEYNHEEF